MIRKITLFLAFISFTAFFGQQSYYNDVNLNLTGITLKQELATKIISTHTRFLSYSEIWDASKITDVNPQNNQEVLLIYGWENGSDADVTNDRTRGINNNGGNVGEWNREHVYSRSLGTPNLGEAGPGSDAHHLRPSDTQKNSSRGNTKFASGSGSVSGSSNGGWYPGDEWKGDVARMMMYMYLRYDDRCLPTNVGFGDSSSTPDDMIDLFLQWNAEDPVSDVEKQRNSYHENTTNPFAQGNRNPFIDNPRLATRIWGGPEAEDIWGIYTNSDTEAPTTPTNLMVSNITTFSVDLSWTASTDNVAVTSYDVYINGNLEVATSNTSITLTNLLSDTNYSFAVLAKDVANNASPLSDPINTKTLKDDEAPSIPTNISISNETESTFIVSWSPSSDNTKVALYEVYINNIISGTTQDETYTVNGLSPSTQYQVQVLAADEAGNKSNLSTAITATTTDGSSSNANEIFFSEYVEGSSNNKALELVNLTNADIDLSVYTIKRQANGGQDGGVWQGDLQLSGIIKANDVYVIINGSAAIQKLIDEADFVQPNASQTNFGEPINFNGNDPVGLFKNGNLIDIIGTYNAGSANFAQNKTLRRKTGVSQPNTSFDITNEWDVYAVDTVDDIGSHSAITLSTTNYDNFGISFYPNPSKEIIFIKNTSNKTISNIQLFTLLGKKVYHQKNSTSEIDVKNLSKGIYIVTFEVENQSFVAKIIKQ